eukprot:NODE_1094_length_1109_cov_263.294340_g838_i0.p1 GENE.NODE_1094_length_1109_cov_263.294340_g838_i0~~NODE_1094_length_1109_cov_263.294340_g838_i0.p1  ORF type:complete len:331 (+),score=48.99 NODE_1094_length_1109_cov_263.294340_g838_i0:55-993(+)
MPACGVCGEAQVGVAGNTCFRCLQSGKRGGFKTSSRRGVARETQVRRSGYTSNSGGRNVTASYGGGNYSGGGNVTGFAANYSGGGNVTAGYGGANYYGSRQEVAQGTITEVPTQYFQAPATVHPVRESMQYVRHPSQNQTISRKLVVDTAEVFPQETHTVHEWPMEFTYVDDVVNRHFPLEETRTIHHHNINEKARHQVVESHSVHPSRQDYGEERGSVKEILHRAPPPPAPRIEYEQGVGTRMVERVVESGPPTARVVYDGVDRFATTAGPAVSYANVGGAERFITTAGARSYSYGAGPPGVYTAPGLRSA